MARVTLNGLRSINFKVDARWLAKQVYIWSREHGAYWRPEGSGYTDDKAQAGVFGFEDAFERTKHCGREKLIEYIAVPRTPTTRPTGREGIAMRTGKDGRSYIELRDIYLRESFHAYRWFWAAWVILVVVWWFA